MTREDGCLIWLSITRGLGQVRIRALLEHFGTACAVWESSREAWADIVGARVADEMQKTRSPEAVNQYCLQIKQLGGTILTQSDPRYPALLLQTPDHPVVLYAKGDLGAMALPCACIVGSRACTRYGEKVAATFAGALADAGACIVSGGAMGIDECAAKEALHRGGKTIAVLGTGLDGRYPAQTALLQDEIAKKGLLLTEFPLGAKPLRGHFPARNRILAGLSRAVIVAEAGKGSGALSTASWAVDYDRELFTVPGSIFSPASFETNRLLRTSAQVALEPADVLPALGLAASAAPASALQPANAEPLPPLTPEEKRIVQALKRGETDFDTLVEETGLAPGALNSHLTMLQMQGIIVKAPGRSYALP